MKIEKIGAYRVGDRTFDTIDDARAFMREADAALLSGKPPAEIIAAAETGDGPICDALTRLYSKVNKARADKRKAVAPVAKAA